MFGKSLRGVMWVGKGTVFTVGLAVILAAVFGAASMAFAANGKPLLQGRNNVASAITTLTKQGAGPALRLFVRPGNPPMAVNSATRVANLNADKVDGKDAAGFLASNGKAADSDKVDGEDASAFANSAHNHAGGEINTGTVDEARIDADIARDNEVMPNVLGNDGSGSNLDADTLDGQNGNAFANASHNHDPAYIQQSPSSAENASIHINGTLRTNGLLRTGSETGTSQPPNLAGLVVRRINSTNPNDGQVLARTDELRLERFGATGSPLGSDGSAGGLRIAWDNGASTFNTVHCMGIDDEGAAKNKYINSAGGGAGTVTVYPTTENVLYATCSFGNSYTGEHVTQVTLQRRSLDNFWVGTVTSTFNQ